MPSTSNYEQIQNPKSITDKKKLQMDIALFVAPKKMEELLLMLKCHYFYLDKNDDKLATLQILLTIICDTFQNWYDNYWIIGCS